MKTLTRFPMAGRATPSLMVVPLLLAVIVPCSGAPREELTQNSLRVLRGPEQTHVESLTEKYMSLAKQGRFREAKPIAQEVLTIRERSRGLEHWETQNAKREIEFLNLIIVSSSIS